MCQSAAKKDRKLYKRQWIKDDSRKYKKCAKVSCVWEAKLFMGDECRLPSVCTAGLIHTGVHKAR